MSIMIRLLSLETSYLQESSSQISQYSILPRHIISFLYIEPYRKYVLSSNEGVAYDQNKFYLR